MATTTVLYDAFVSINSVDRSAQVKSVSLPMTIAQLDASAMGDETTVYAPGLKGFSMELELHSDFTDDEDDEDFFALWDGRTTFAVAIRPSSGSVGAANPSYSFTGFISAWNPIQGAHGDLSGGSMTITNTTAITRSVA